MSKFLLIKGPADRAVLEAKARGIELNNVTYRAKYDECIAYAETDAETLNRWFTEPSGCNHPAVRLNPGTTLFPDGTLLFWNEGKPQ